MMIEGSIYNSINHVKYISEKKPTLEKLLQVIQN